MAQPSLQSSIEQARISMNQVLDDHERDLLGDLMTRMAGGSVDEQAHFELRSKAAEFEVSHPKMARSIQEVLDSLNKMGI